MRSISRSRKASLPKQGALQVYGWRLILVLQKSSPPPGNRNLGLLVRTSRRQLLRYVAREVGCNSIPGGDAPHPVLPIASERHRALIDLLEVIQKYVR
jgi:hypothetical protein